MLFLAYPLTNLGHVTVGQHVEVGLQAGIVNGFPIPLCFERPTETNIVSNGGILIENSVHLASLSSSQRPTWIQALWEQYATDPPTRTEPSVLRMSPIKPWSNDVFPDPTSPTMATSCPRGTLRSMCFNLNSTSSLPSFGPGTGAGLGWGSLRFFFFPLSSLPSWRSGGGLSQVNDALSISTAYFKFGSCTSVSETSSAVKHSWRRPIAFRASAIVFKDRAIT